MTLPSAAVLAVIARDAVGVSAVASISYGSWLIYPPAGFIAGGLLVLAGVLLNARNDGGA